MLRQPYLRECDVPVLGREQRCRAEKRETHEADCRSDRQRSNEPQQYTDQSTYPEDHLKQRCDDDRSLYLRQYEQLMSKLAEWINHTVHNTGLISPYHIIFSGCILLCNTT